MKRAFTLIELLVVIAIIAILAAILFPVFAQAKVAAKGTGSINNLKQISTASLMYAGDADDMLVRAGTWGVCGNPDALWPSANCADPNANYATWALSIDPYQKSVEINSSPLGNNAVRGGEIARRVGTRFMAYGYNYSYLTPAPYPTDPIRQNSVSGTSFGQPANTVMYTEHVSRGNQALTNIWYMGPDTAVWLGLAEIPDCYTNPDIWCLDGWGNDGIYAGAITLESEGRFMGGNAPRKTGSIPTAWLDGHVSSPKPGQLTAGTNWQNRPGVGVPNGGITMTDRTQYVWDNQ